MAKGAIARNAIAAILWTFFVADVVAAATMANRALESLHTVPAYRTSGPLVSIIIPTLEEQDYVGDLLDSICGQTYQDLEVIVVDSSPEGPKQLTQEVLARYGLSLFDLPRLGIAAARNYGAEMAAGEIVMFCDADCIMSPQYVERMVEALGNGAVLAHGVDCFYDSLPCALFSAPWALIKPGWHTTGRGITMRRHDFWEVGGYDEKCDPMQGCREDIDLGRRVADRYGIESLQVVGDAFIGTSARRGCLVGTALWPVRGVRNGQIEY